jgi:hypothetical protein
MLKNILGKLWVLCCEFHVKLDAELSPTAGETVAIAEELITVEGTTQWA